MLRFPSLQDGSMICDAEFFSGSSNKAETFLEATLGVKKRDVDVVKGISLGTSSLEPKYPSKPVVDNSPLEFDDWRTPVMVLPLNE